jgi:hypothetical protein
MFAPHIVKAQRHTWPDVGRKPTGLLTCRRALRNERQVPYVVSEHPAALGMGDTALR